METPKKPYNLSRILPLAALGFATIALVLVLPLYGISYFLNDQVASLDNSVSSQSSSNAQSATTEDSVSELPQTGTTASVFPTTTPTDRLWLTTCIETERGDGTSYYLVQSSALSNDTAVSLTLTNSNVNYTGSVTFANNLRGDSASYKFYLISVPQITKMQVMPKLTYTATVKSTSTTMSGSEYLGQIPCKFIYGYTAGLGSINQQITLKNNSLPTTTPTPTPVAVNQCDVRAYRDFVGGKVDCAQTAALGSTHWYVTTRGDALGIYCSKPGSPLASDCIFVEDRSVAGNPVRQWCGTTAGIFKCDETALSGRYVSAEGDAVTYNCTSIVFPYATGCTKVTTTK